MAADCHGMYSKDVEGGQWASLAFLWCLQLLWRYPPAPFTFEFLSLPNSSVVKYTLKSYEFMNFTGLSFTKSISPRGKFPHSEGMLQPAKKREDWYSMSTSASCSLELTSCKGGSVLISYKGHLFVSLVCSVEWKCTTLLQSVSKIFSLSVC